MRPYIPPEYDADFAGRFLQKEGAGEDPDNLESSGDDIDVTARGLLARYSELLFPHIYTIEITARAEQAEPEARHGAALLYLLRRSALWAPALLLLIAVARSWPEWSVRLLPHALLQCGACVVLHTLFGRAWSTSFAVMLYIAVLVLVTSLLLGHSQAVLLLVLMMITVGVATADTPFQTALRATSLVIYSILAVSTGAAFAWHLPPVIALIAAPWSMLVVAKLVAQSGILWMAANRSAPLDLLHLHLLPDLQSDEWSALQSKSTIVTSVAYVCGLALVLPMAAFLAICGPPSELTTFLVLAVGNVGWWAAVHIVNWLFVELTFHRRMPEPMACLRSIYVAWRTLSVWIAYVPALRAPAVFQFPRPWSQRWLRLLLLNWAVLTCGALPIGLLVECMFIPATSDGTAPAESHRPTGDEIPGGSVLLSMPRELSRGQSRVTLPPMDDEVWAAFEEAPPDPPDDEQRLTPKIHLSRVFDYRFLIFAICSAALAPPLILWLGLAAVWGPALTAAHDCFELHDESVAVPVLYPPPPSGGSLSESIEGEDP